ncbi:ATPase [Candidatus Scalindua japonica]|uniref:ATPase n=2 Tax=Candidatus Scalindua japonica TaxID=1284222 RepID=A0A286U2M3_9BACT|nr:ATPase [Candidatus Scalindua japonica]
MQATNSHDSSSKEGKRLAGIVDDLLSIEDEIKEKCGKRASGSEVGIEEKPVIDLETIEENVKNREVELTAKFTTELDTIRGEFTAKIKGLISKIEEREKEVVDIIENIIDAKVQENLSEMSGRISEALKTQKNSTVSVLEKLVDSLRKEEVFDEKIDSADVGKKDFRSFLNNR